MNHLSEHLQEIRRISPQQSGLKRFLLRAFILVFSLFCLYMACRGIRWDEFLRIITSARYELLPLVLIIASLNYFLRALRWRVLLSLGRAISPLDVFWANMVGYLSNNIFPARAGEVVRAYFVGKRCSAAVSYVFATCMLERIGDVFALVGIGSVCLLTMNLFNTELAGAIELFLLLGILGIAAIVFLPRIKALIFSWLGRFPAFQKIQGRVEQSIDQFSSGVAILRNGRVVVSFVLFTILIWFVDALTTVLGASIFHLNLTLPLAFVLLAAMGLSSAIPSTPGYIGVYQFVAVLVLVPFGYSQATAVAYMTASQVINFFLVALWGGAGLMRLPITKGEPERGN